MDQAAWKALVEHYQQVSKNIDRRKAKHVFRQNVKAVVAAMPETDRGLLQSHWLAAKEVTHPFLGTKHPVPLFLVATNFAFRNMPERATGMMVSEGCCYVFEEMFVHTAPGEAVQSLIAHELAHGWLYAKYHSQKLPLPPVTVPIEELDQIYSEYPIDKRHEEWLADEIITKWGFVGYLVAYWELAIEDAPKDPNRHYSLLKRLARDNPMAMGVRPARRA
jgi:hypothetical protein